MKRLTLETIVKRLKRYRPLNAHDVLVDCKLPLEFIKEIDEWCEDNGFIEADVDHRKMDNYGMLGKQLKILDLGCFVSGGSNC